MAEPIEPESDPVDQLAGRVQEHFRAAVKRGRRMPDIDSCREIARFLEALREPRLGLDPIPVRSSLFNILQAKRVLLVPPDPEADAVKTLGGDFLRALSNFAPRLDATDQQRCKQFLASIMQFLFFLDPGSAPPADCLAIALTGKRVPDAVEIVAMLARYAWAKADNIQKYRSNEKTGPLCKFVVAALGEIGLHSTPATVASILQGRRHRDRVNASFLGILGILAQR